ncbi:MAG: glycoside hydrolase family 5 protein, partial [Bacteroidales bacterium]|nr:glycoside hydrolase family 5 protein [Bacteroidales bacterium]
MKNPLTLVAIAMILFAGCNSSAPKLAPLKVEGTQLTADGKPVTMRGISFGWHNIWPRFYNKGAVRSLSEDWGVPVFRAAIGADSHAKADNPGIHGGYMDEPEFALDCLYGVVDGAIECGAYVIVDWHSHVLHLEEAKEFFSIVAERYADCPNVIYELYNEPVNDSWPELKAYAEELIKVIDGISKVHPLILMG